MLETIIRCDVDEGDKRAKGRTVRFSLDGQGYEVDLCPKHEREFKAMGDGCAAAGRRAAALPRQRAARPGLSGGRTHTRQEAATMRDWARRNGWPSLPDRGRIPRAAELAYAETRANGGR